MEIKYKPIGIIHSPFKNIEGIPIQPSGAKGIQGRVEFHREFVDGLKDLDGFSHIILLYHFHLSKGYSLKVIPFLDDSPKGLFATRAPKRPNPIGISVVKIIRIEDNSIFVENIDIVNGTPLLDIKPYASFLDNVENEKIGWLSKNVSNVKSIKSDERFK